jgi:hypothetical protein
LHLLIFKRRWLHAHMPVMLLQTCILLSFSAPYYWYVLTAPKAPREELEFSSLLFPFLSARFFTMKGFSYFLDTGWQTWPGWPRALSALVTWLSALTWLAYPVAFLGIFLALSIMRVARSESALRDPVIQGSALALGVLMLHGLSCLRVPPEGEPHYYDGVWIVGLFFFWQGLARLWPRRWFRKAFAVYLAAMAFFLGDIILKVHVFEGSRALHYGPTLSNQMEIAAQLNRYPKDVAVERVAFHPSAFPHAISFLQEMDTSHRGPGLSAPKNGLVIRYKLPDDQDNGGIVLEEKL